MFIRPRKINHSHINRIVVGDPYISKMYRDIYEEFSRIVKSNLNYPPKVLEIGGGDFGFAKEYWTDVKVTDADSFSEDPSILTNVHAENLPFENSTFDVVIAKDSLHHFKDPEKGIEEILRVLKSKGMFIVSEPNWSLLGRLIYRFFHPEPWDTKVDKLPRASKHLWDSNQALLFLLQSKFKSDIKHKFPNLDITILSPTYGISYLISGGVHRRSFVPSNLLLKINSIEKNNKFLLRTTGLNRIAIFRKK